MVDARADLVGGRLGGGRGDELAFEQHRLLLRAPALLRPLRLGALPARCLVGRFEGIRGAGPVEPAGAIGVLRPVAEAHRAPAERALGRDDLDVGLGQFVDEARRGGGLVEAAHAPVLRERDERLAPCPRDADVGEPAFLLEAGEAAFVHRALVGEEAFLPAGQEDVVELEALGGMQRHERDLVAVVGLGGVHDQRDVLEEALHGVEFVHEAHEFLEVFETRMRLRALVRLPHRSVAAVVEDEFGEFGVAHGLSRAPPVVELAHQAGERLARLAGEFFRLDDLAGGLEDGDATGAGERADAVDRGVADAALGRVDDALELEVVGGVVRDLEIGDGVLDLEALVELRAADHAVGNTERYEAVLERAHLRR